MNKKLLIGIIVVIVGLVIAATIIRAMFIPAVLGVALVGVWIYLVYVVRKKKISLFHDQMEPELAERRLRKLKIFLRVGGISLVVGIVGVIVHNALHALSEVCEPVSFGFTLVGFLVFVIATIGALVIFLMGR